ncbi:hypothetical protein [Legionella oakridgensis]|uniref:Uncharacterized protein n=2 Tax=Legionella oakridgensis TaxID=29423 RepID=W0BEK8_9GAMM|nr:hypothetical protein [Legionella oakridgensis]AHE67141.1 hypothetical protein Loa_01593 [Legionella oakridgensis ATCC 33761 = DSM 21215]ETO93237.1 hypothetical protein LOR_18c01680 [Legionella oakridgensis RV-2-2007]KTD38052.1 hypothetical protein Loak_1728 [Legionella oakridgensis]STY20226.1 Uncharacterised protein [Legionella longbeachae]
MPEPTSGSSTKTISEGLTAGSTEHSAATSAGAGGQARPHSDICRCTMCMKSKLDDEVAASHEHALKSTMVDRRNPDNPIRPLMKAMEAHAILRAGTQVDLLAVTGLQADDLPISYDAEPVEPEELIVEATWKHRSVEAARSGRDASVFGGLGVLLIPKDIKLVDIPKMNALAVPPSFLKHYGAELISLKEPVTIDPVAHKELEELYLVQYDFDKDYIEQYVMNIAGGGGLFVETHPFAHVFTPLSRDCSGALILGVNLGDGRFSFAAFQIPFGFTMKIGANVIHGDSFFVGPYAIALTETDLADSVLFKQETPERGIQRVSQRAVAPAQLPILAEYRLARTINNLMMIDKIRHEGAAGKGLSFFQQLPTEVLTRVSDLSEEAEEAYEERLKMLGR